MRPGLVLALAGCTEWVCPEGYGLAEDGLCYPLVVAPAATSVVVSLPDTGGTPPGPTDPTDPTETPEPTPTTDTATPPVDTGPYADPDLGREIELLGWVSGCAGPDWVISATVRGESSAAIYNAWETGVLGGWGEEHSVPALGAAGGVQTLERVLAPGAPAWQQDLTTRFVCGLHDVSGTLTHALRVYDGSGQLADCVVWGDDPLGARAGAYPSPNPVTAPDELTGCRVAR